MVTLTVENALAMVDFASIKSDMSPEPPEEHPSKRARRNLTAVAGDQEPYELSDTTFADKNNDGQIQFDYNDGAVSEEDEAKLRFVMQVVQNQGTQQLSKAGQDFTRDTEVWIQFFAKYPLLFNFRSRQSKTFSESDFSLTANTDLVKSLVDDSAPDAVKKSLLAALQSNGGDVIKTTKKEANVQFLCLIRRYSKASTLTIYKAELHNKVVDIKTMCGSAEKVDLDIAYDEIVFELNNALAIAMYEPMMKVAKDKMVDFVSEFFQKMAAGAIDDFNDWINGLGK